MYLAVYLMLLLMIWCQHSSFLKRSLLKAMIQHILRVHNKGTKVNRSLSLVFLLFFCCFFFCNYIGIFPEKWNLQICVELSCIKIAPRLPKRNKRVEVNVSACGLRDIHVKNPKQTLKSNPNGIWQHFPYAALYERFCYVRIKCIRH